MKAIDGLGQNPSGFADAGISLNHHHPIAAVPNMLNGRSLLIVQIVLRNFVVSMPQCPTGHFSASSEPNHFLLFGQHVFCRDDIATVDLPSNNSRQAGDRLEVSDSHIARAKTKRIRHNLLFVGHRLTFEGV